MKCFLTKKEKEVGKEFQPVILSFYCESIEELRLLFHVCNRSNLKEKLFEDNYKLSSYSDNVSAQIGTYDYKPPYRLIKEEIQRQGFDI